MMNEELVQAAKAAAELEPAIEAFGEATGALQVVREVTGSLTDQIRYRRMVRQAKLLTEAAEKIKATGLPAHAVSDKLLRSVVEDAAVEDDATMQDRWANLLANAAITRDGDLRFAFPKILSELEPAEATLLEEFAGRTSSEKYSKKKFSVEEPGPGGERIELENLERLRLIRYAHSMPTTLGSVSDDDARITGFYFTRLGWEFLEACREPQPNSNRLD